MNRHQRRKAVRQRRRSQHYIVDLRELPNQFDIGVDAKLIGPVMIQANAKGRAGLAMASLRRRCH